MEKLKIHPVVKSYGGRKHPGLSLNVWQPDYGHITGLQSPRPTMRHKYCILFLYSLVRAINKPFLILLCITGERLNHKLWFRQENNLGFSKLTFSIAFNDQGLRLLNLEFQKHTLAKNNSCCWIPIHRATADAASGPTATRSASVNKAKVPCNLTL